MTAKRISLEEQAAALLAAAPTDTNPPKSGSTGRLRALSALVRPATFRLLARLLSWVVLFAVGCVLLLIALATLPTLVGYHTYIVYGGSMGASLPPGSVAVSKATSAEELSVGDVITRRESPDSVAVLHRIIDITVVDGQRLFFTQGDANEAPDPDPAIFEGTGDRVVYSVPFAGYLLDYAQGGQGKLLLIVAPLALLAVMHFREKWNSWRKQRGAVAGEGAPIRAITPAEPVEEEYRDTA